MSVDTGTERPGCSERRSLFPGLSFVAVPTTLRARWRRGLGHFYDEFVGQFGARRVQRSCDPALVTSLLDVVSGGLGGAQLAVDACDLASATRPMSGPRSRTLSGDRVGTGHGGRRDGRGTVILRRTRAPVPPRSRQLRAFDLRVMPLVVVRTSGRAQRRGSAGPSSSGTRRRTGRPRPRAPTTQRARHPRPRGRRSPWSRSRPAT
jgi:hypothetical protein